MATRGVAVKPATEDAELARLRAENAELEQEVERLEDILFLQEFRVVEGYVVAVWAEEDGTFLATCNKLHATVQEDTKEQALVSVREAMTVVREGMASVGREIPVPDVA
jgi:predicted RNase H-like HicB family nuclease